MAYPTVETTNYGHDDSISGTSHTVNLPSGISASDLLLIFFGLYTSSVNTPSGLSTLRTVAVSGGENFDLNADNIAFNSFASIHVQYTGTDTLTWTNSNSSNASIGSTPNRGTITSNGLYITVLVKPGSMAQ